MGTGNYMVGARNHLVIAHTVEGNTALPVLRRLYAVIGVYHSRWFWNGAKIFGYQCQCFWLVNFACHQEHGAVGLIIFFVKSLEVLNRHALNVFLRPYGGFAVIVP